MTNTSSGYPSIVDPSALLDRSRCPVCGSVLRGSICGVCRADLSGAGAREIWDLSTRIVSLWDQRKAAIARLPRATVSPAPAGPQPTVGAPPPAGPMPGGPPPVGPMPGGPPPVGPPRVGPPSHTVPPGVPAPVAQARTRWALSVQAVLLGLGALLLSVAVLIFLARSWDQMSLGVRAVVVGVLTVATLGAASSLGRRLPATAEAIGAIGVILVLADSWAVYRTGFLGADRLPVPLYIGFSLAVAALVLGGWSLASRLRVGLIAGTVLAPAAPLFVGAQLASDEDSAVWLVLAGLVSGAVTLARHRLPADYAAERVLARIWALLAAVLAGSSWTVSLVTEEWVSAAVVVPAAALLAAGQGQVELARHRVISRGRPSTGSSWSARAWSYSAGVSMTLVAVPVALQFVTVTAVSGWWVLSLIPWIIGLCLVALTWAVPRFGRIAVHPRAIPVSASTTFVAAVLPAVLLSWWWNIAMALSWLWPSQDEALWATSLRTPLIELAGPGAPVDEISAAFHPALCVALAAPIVVLTLLSLPGPFPGAVARRRRELDALAVGATVPVLVTVALAPSMPLSGAIAALMSIAVIAVVVLVGSAPSVSRQLTPLRGVGILAVLLPGVLALMLSWNAASVAVPVTVFVMGALILLRGTVPEILRPILSGTAVVLLAPALATAVALADADGTDQILVIGIGYAVLVTAVVLSGWRHRTTNETRATRWVRGERATVASLGVFGALTTELVLSALWIAGDVSAWRLTLLFGVGAATALGIAVRGQGPWGRWGAVVGAAAVPPLTAITLGSACTGDMPTPGWSVLLAVQVAVSYLLISLVTVLTTQDGTARRRRLAAELSTAAVALVALLSLTVSVDESRLWVVLLLLGTGVSATAVQPDRRRWGWLAGGLITLSSWSRLQLSDVSLVEAYTLPPAAALFVVGAVTRWRNRQANPWRIWGPGAGAAAIPSVVTAVGGGDLRPWLLLSVAVGLIGSTWVIRACRDMKVPVVAGTFLALGVGLGRPLSALFHGDLGWDRIEQWSWPAAVMVFSAVAVLRLPGTSVRVSRTIALAAGAGLVWLPTEMAIFLSTADQEYPAGTLVWRGAAVLAVAFLVAIIDLLALRSAGVERLRSHLVVSGVPTQAVGAALLTVLFEVGNHPAVPERWTVPAAVFLLILGGAAMRRSERISSWPALGPGTALLLLPSVWVAAGHGGTVRIVAVTVVATAVVVLGAVGRLKAPLVIGGVLLTAHALVQVGPQFVVFAGTVPRWVVFSLAGSVLLGLGITYERRIAQAKAWRSRFQQYR